MRKKHVLIAVLCIVVSSGYAHAAGNWQEATNTGRANTGDWQYYRCFYRTAYGYEFSIVRQDSCPSSIRVDPESGLVQIGSPTPVNPFDTRSSTAKPPSIAEGVRVTDAPIPPPPVLSYEQQQEYARRQQEATIAAEVEAFIIGLRNNEVWQRASQADRQKLIVDWEQNLWPPYAQERFGGNTSIADATKNALLAAARSEPLAQSIRADTVNVTPNERVLPITSDYFFKQFNMLAQSLYCPLLVTTPNKTEYDNGLRVDSYNQAKNLTVQIYRYPNAPQKINMVVFIGSINNDKETWRSVLGSATSFIHALGAEDKVTMLRMLNTLGISPVNFTDGKERVIMYNNMKVSSIFFQGITLVISAEQQ